MLLLVFDGPMSNNKTKGINRTGNEGVAGFKSTCSSGDGRAVKVQRHDGRIGHEFTRRSRAAKIINLFFVATDRDEGRHAVRSVAAVNAA